MKVLDISSELSRTYHYSNGTRFKISDPRKLYLKQDDQGDSHRVITKEGEVFYPARGWIALSWMPVDGDNPVDF